MRQVFKSAAWTLAVLIGLSLGGCNQPAEIGQEGAPFPMDKPFKTLDGTDEPMAQHAGKVIVLNVWATWCPPCRREMPSLKRLGEVLDPEKFEVVAVSRDLDPEKARQFIRQFDLPFARLHDPKKAITNDLLVDVLPTTFIIDPGGRIAVREIGAREWDDPEMIARLRDIEWDAASRATE